MRLAAPLFAVLLAAPKPVPLVPASSVGMSHERLGRIDGVVNEAILRKETPGAVVVVGRHGKVIFRRAYGNRALVPDVEPMTVDTAFDLASLTKVVATAMSVMTLLERGALRLDDAVVKHLPDFGAGGGLRDKVTVEELLTHRAGLPPDDPMELYQGSPEDTFARKYRQPLAGTPGAQFVYSDAGFEVLGELVRKVSGLSLDEYTRKNVLDPLGMEETEFRPEGKPAALSASRIAPTEKRGDQLLRGVVHDPRAFALGGVAGHAGLFSTADDLSRFCSAILAGGGGVLSPAGVAAMTRPRVFGKDGGDGNLRGLGWDIATSYSSNRGDLFPLGSFGHTGWTGTSIWLDPVTDTFVIVLTNRNHPDGAGNVVPLRGKIATIAAAALTDVSPEVLRDASNRLVRLAFRHDAAPAPPGPSADRPSRAEVRAGIDVLEADGFSPIAGKRVVLLTNQTGLARDGRPTIDVLRSERARAAGVTLVRLFSPEHGIGGLHDGKVPDGRDERTGLAVRSLYGESRRPAREDLEGVDAVVVDLQDAGCRFYTYLTTLGYVLEEAARARVAVVVLDRPDPIGADVVEGPPADPDTLSFTAYHPIPIRTGMTIGELATLFNGERKLGADLTVVKMTGYRRGLWYDETGLPWTNPSPNLRSVTEAALYPGVALLEPTNLSVGRGTESPFELVGAPWIDGAALTRTLQARGIPGVRVARERFTPSSGPYKGEACDGIHLSVTDRKRLDPIRLGLEIATALKARHPNEWDRSRLGALLANAAALARFERGESAREIASGWAAQRMEFERTRARYLLY